MPHVRPRRAVPAATTALVAVLATIGVRFAADAATTPAPTAPAIPFAHPGVLLSQAQLDRVKARVAAKAAPTNARTPSRRTPTRPQGTDNLFVAWESLTHANNPA